VILTIALAVHVATGAVTYTKDIAPLIADRCAMCHHDGGSAPFPLVTYDQVRRHAAQIATVTRKRFMPPWKADPADGPFVGQHPLSRGEIAAIQQWVDDGVPEGDQSAPTPKRTWSEGWQLGTPDLVVTIPRPFTLQADGTDVFRIFVIPLPVDRVRFVRGVEFRPGNPKVVHHANIRLDHTTASRELDDADPQPGYNGLVLRSADYPEGHFLGWTPGQVAPLLPPEVSWRLVPPADLVVEVHMQPSGREEAVQPSIGLYFGDRPPTKTPAILRLGRQNIDIPAGDGHYVVTDSYELPVDVEVEAVQPHAHYRARDVRGEATLPDGTVVPLIHIADWDFRWQHVYRFMKPFMLPKGTMLAMRYVYDNSSANPRNPQRPPARARWGQRSADEMGDLWIQVLTRSEPDLVTLTREFRAKVAAEDVIGYESEISARPAEAALHDDAAMLYLELGRVEKAIEHFKAALTLKPPSAAAHYNLGTALTMARRLDAAAVEYKEAIRLDAGYVNAHNNLGNVWLAQGRTADAIREFAEVVRLQPSSPSGLANLAAAYAAAGDFDRAVANADAALRAQPPEPLAAEIRRQRDRYRAHERPKMR